MLGSHNHVTGGDVWGPTSVSNYRHLCVFSGLSVGRDLLPPPPPQDLVRKISGSCFLRYDSGPVPSVRPTSVLTDLPEDPVQTLLDRVRGLFGLKERESPQMRPLGTPRNVDKGVGVRSRLDLHPIVRYVIFDVSGFPEGGARTGVI